MDEGNDRRRDAWKYLLEVLSHQRRGLAIGIAIGLVWTVGKIAIPQLTRHAIDSGIEQRWFGRHLGGADRLRRVDDRDVHRAAPLRRVPREPVDRNAAARAAVRPHPRAAHRLPRPSPDRTVDEPLVERSQPDAGVRRDDPDHDLEPRPRRRRRGDPGRHRSVAGARRARAAPVRERHRPRGSRRRSTRRCWRCRPSRRSSPRSSRRRSRASG